MILFSKKGAVSRVHILILGGTILERNIHNEVHANMAYESMGREGGV